MTACWTVGSTVRALVRGLALLGFTPLERYGRHLAHSVGHSLAFQDEVAAALPRLRKRLDVSGPVVITGDLNVVEPDHEPRYAVFGQWEYDFYRAFAAAGYVDAFRQIQPEGMDHSWFGRAAADGTRNGYRFDHTFITANHATAVRECRYQHDIREEGFTDHSAMLTVIAV